MRPQRGSRARSSTGARQCCAPRARTSAAVAVKTSPISVGFHVEESAIAIGITGATRSDMSVEALVVKHNGNSKTGVFFYPFLNAIGELSHGARTAALARARDFSQSIFQNDAGLLRKKSSFAIHEIRFLLTDKLGVLPGTFHLRELLFERHARRANLRRVARLAVLDPDREAFLALARRSRARKS